MQRREDRLLEKGFLTGKLLEIRARDRGEDILDNLMVLDLINLAEVEMDGVEQNEWYPHWAEAIRSVELPLLTEEGNGPVVVGDWIVQVTPHMEDMSSQSEGSLVKGHSSI